MSFFRDWPTIRKLGAPTLKNRNQFFPDLLGVGFIGFVCRLKIKGEKMARRQCDEISAKKWKVKPRGWVDDEIQN